MIDVRGHVQAVLDAALFAAGVRVFWRRRAETKDEEPLEYIVYTLDSDSAEQHADDNPLTRVANVAVRYYYHETLLDTPSGREAVKAREREIAAAVLAGGFLLPNGYFDTGDIEGNGYCTTIFECDLWEVV